MFDGKKQCSRESERVWGAKKAEADGMRPPDRTAGMVQRSGIEQAWYNLVSPLGPTSPREEMSLRTARLFILIVLPLLATCPASATSYVPVTDEALVDHAPVIAVVKVQDSGSGPQSERPSTVYRVRVEKVVKGAMAPGLVIRVRVPGGVREDGKGLRIWGAPRFERGERAMLFLTPRADGSFEIFHLMLGAFHEITGGGRRLAVRHLSEAQAVVRPGETLPQEPLRDFDRFADWVDRQARGMRAPADYEVAATHGLAPITSLFSLFDGGDGFNLRWFEFDSNVSVDWRAHQDGQQGVAGGGFTEFQTALAAWNGDPNTNISYTYGGTTSNTNGLIVYDEVNAILFNDPNDEVPSFSCGFGGVLAMGGPWYETATTPHQGTFYHAIVNADIVTNNGISCFFQNSVNGSKAAEELFAHELGHTLGIGHSTIFEALMYPFIHDDARGALLHEDDRAAIAALYASPPLPTDFFTLAPCRLLDTRNPIGPLGGPALLAGQPRTFAAAGQCGIPSTAVSLSVNVTIVSPTGAGHLTLFPADKLPPGTSTLSFSGSQTRANNAILLLSAAPSQAFTALPSLTGNGTVHLVVDVNGYFE
jgi:matrixin